MSSEKSGRQPTPETVGASDLNRLVAALAATSGYPVDGCDLDRLVEWLQRARTNYALSQLVLEGAVVVHCEQGQLIFSRRQPFDCSAN